MTTDPLVRRFNPAGPNYGPSGLDTPLRDEERREAAMAHLFDLIWAETKRPKPSVMYVIPGAPSPIEPNLITICGSKPFGHSPRAAVSLGGAAAHISEP